MTTAAPKRSIFRGKAVQTYLQNREKSVLPRIVAPPVFFFCWILLIVLTAAGVAAWLGQVPLYVTGSGMIVNNTLLPDQGSDEAVAVILLPASASTRLRVGLPAQVQIGQAGLQLMRTVTLVNSTLLSPSEVQQQYGIAVTDPSLVVAVRLGPDVSRRVYAGSPVHAQIQVGSQRLLALFPIFNSLFNNA